MKIKRPGLLVWISLSAATVLTACGEEKVGEPVANGNGQVETSWPSGPTQPSSTSQPIPPISTPLDPSPWLSSPCDALSSEDLARLRLSEGEERELEDGSAARACAWDLSDAERVDLSVMDNNQDGLNAIYRNHENSELREQVDIGGYPALHANFTDRRDSGECSLWVGVNDSQVLFLHTFLDEDSAEGEAPCVFADRVGKAIVGNLGR